jgi:hypothetical protein
MLFRSGSPKRVPFAEILAKKATEIGALIRASLLAGRPPGGRTRARVFYDPETHRSPDRQPPGPITLDLARAVSLQQPTIVVHLTCPAFVLR